MWHMVAILHKHLGLCIVRNKSIYTVAPFVFTTVKHIQVLCNVLRNQCKVVFQGNSLSIQSSRGNETCEIISLEKEQVLCHWMKLGTDAQLI